MLETSEEEEHELHWADKGYFDRLVFIVEFPLVWLKQITMPPCDITNYDRILFMVWPFPGLFFTIWVFNMFNMENVWKVSGIAFVLSNIFY